MIHTQKTATILPMPLSGQCMDYGEEQLTKWDNQFNQH